MKVYVLIVIDVSSCGLGIKDVEVWCRKDLDEVLKRSGWEEIEKNEVVDFDVDGLIEEELRGKIWRLDRSNDLEEVWYLVEVKCESSSD